MHDDVDALRRPSHDLVPDEIHESLPQVPEGMVWRPALLERIDLGVSRGLTVVSGPAGSGKTLLLAGWAACRTAPPAWLDVVAEDAEPEQFWAHVLQALQSSPSVARDTLLATIKPPPTFDRRFVTNLVDACQQQPRPVVLVLEDLHVLAGTPAMATLYDAVRRGLGRLRLVIASRTEPALPLERLRVSGQLTEVTADDLAFRDVDVARLLDQYDVQLDAEQLRTVLDRTEGWAAGVRLVALSMASSSDPGATLSQLVGDQRRIADFFVEEVLGRLEPELIDFLSDTCLPRRICAGLANALTGRTDSQQLLTRLERENLFVVALDDRRSWYRYHHLFGELLRHRLSFSSPERAPQLHRSAAAWFAAHGEPLEAARHLADAGAWHELARFCLRDAGAHMLGMHRHALVEVLHRIPMELTLTDAELTTAVATAAYAEYDSPTLHALVRQARELLPTADPEQVPVVEAVLATLDAVGAWLEGDAEREVETATEAIARLDALGPAVMPALPGYRGGATIVLGVGLLWSGRLDEAEAVLTQTVTALRSSQAMTPVLAVHLHGNLAVLRSLQGRLHESHAEAATAMQVAEQSGWLFLPQTGPALLAEAFCQMAEGDYEQCALTIERCHNALGGLDDRITLTGLAMAQTRLYLTVPDAPAAAATMAALRRRTAGWRMPWFLARWCDLVELETTLHTEDAEARERLLAAVEQSWGPARPEAHRATIVARAHLASGRSERALEVLAPVLELPPRDLVPATEAWVLAAIAHDRMQRDSEVVPALDRALSIAAPNGIVRPFLLHGDRMVTLLERHRQVTGTHREFAEGVLARLRSHEQEPPGADLMEPLTDRERAVLQLLPTMMSNGEIAAELYVSVNTVKVHLKALYRKLGVGSRRQAVARARALGLLAGSPDTPGPGQRFTRSG